jgi:DNA-binding NarL/FixJ family response regulator
VRHAAQAGRADVVLLYVDVSGPALADTVGELRKFSSTLAVVGLSESDDPRLVVEAVRSGVRGWVEPTASADHLVAVLHGVARGETWIPPHLLTGVLDALTASQDSRAELGEALAGLSTRELEILGCLVQGMTRPEIAERYVLSTHTVRTHINNLLRKLDVHSTLAAVALARQAGLPDQPMS